MKKFSIITFAFLLFTFTVSIFAQDETRVAAAWRVLKYDIMASVPQNPADRYLTAKVVLNLQNVGNGAGSRLTLRVSNKAEVASVAANNSPATFTKNEEKLGTGGSLQRIIVNLPPVQPNANVAVAVEYKLKVDENSGLNAISPTGAQFLPQSFWYPTPNSQLAARGADFAPFSLTVTQPNSPYFEIVSSGDGGDVTSSGKTSTSFNQKLNAQPFFIAGTWDAVQVKGVEIYLPKGASDFEKKRAEELANLAIEAKTFTASLLGGATETPTRIVAVRRGAGFSDGAAIFLDYGAFRRRKIDSQTAMTIAEAIAKTYLGNATTVRGEGFGVIREGLSKFVATQFLEKQYGKDAGDIERLRQRTAFAAVARHDAPLSTAVPVDNFYFAAVSNKGAMIWRLLAKNVGEQEFWSAVRAQIQSGTLNLTNLRAAFPVQKAFLDYELDQPTTMNLLAGLPQTSGAETKVALRNLGAIDAAVTVAATTERGEKLTAQVRIPAQNFGEASFKTASKIVRAEVDSEKLYPQTDFSDDVAPREFTDTDPILAVKRAFDKQDFAAAEKNARTALASAPHFDDARTWLARALLAQGKTIDAGKEFQAVLDENLPTPRSLAWASVGLGEIALKNNQNAQAVKFFDEAIDADAEYGATLNARLERDKAAPPAPVDETVRAFFAQFDKSATSGRKTDMDALIAPGEIPRFSVGIGGLAQAWQTTLVRVSPIDANNVLAETSLNIKLLHKEPESGTAVFQLSKVAGGWKMSGVEIFEVR